MRENTVLMKLADAAEARGADCNDTAGIVRELVITHNLGFYAWFCVCCELADRAACREGYKSSGHRAAVLTMRALGRLDQ